MKFIQHLFLPFACLVTLSASVIAPASFAGEPEPNSQENAEYVVVLHGIARSAQHMSPLTEHLSRLGYSVINVDYPSTQLPLQRLVGFLDEELKHQLPPESKVHFVGYSMGGLLVRAYLNKHIPQNLGRVVMLGTPNHGSEIADVLRDIWLYKEFYGPAGQQLTTDQQNIEHIFGSINFDLGVIAGDFSIDPVSSVIIKGKDDGKVSIESTAITGMSDHIVVSASHTFMPSNEDVHSQTSHFLRHGEFHHSGE